MRLLFFAIMFALLGACANSTSESSVQVQSNAPLSEIKKSLSDSGEIVMDGETLLGRTIITVDWIEFEGGAKGVADELNVAVRSRLNESIYASYGSDESHKASGSPEDLKSVVSGFVKAYQQTKMEFGEEMPWQLSAYFYREYSSPKIMTLHYNLETYTGGAHGYNGNYLINFDPNTGKEIRVLDFIADTLAFKNLLTATFREDLNLKPNQSLSDGGLFEEFKSSLPMPKELGFTSVGMVAIYNPYEIAPYSQGTIVVSLKDEQILPLLVDGKRP